MKGKSITELNTIKQLLQKELLSWEDSSNNISNTLQDRKIAKDQVEKIHVCISNVEEEIHKYIYHFLENYSTYED